MDEISALVLEPTALSSVLAPLEAKGMRLAGAKLTHGPHGAQVALAIRGVGAVAACRRVGEAVGAKCLVSPTSQAEAFELLLARFAGSDLLSDALVASLAGCAHPRRAPSQTAHEFDLAELLAAAPGSPCGVRFCAVLRLEGYVHVRAPKETVSCLRRLEALCAEWYLLPSEAKETDCADYGHVDRKFTGYRQGRYREQLEVRLEAEGGVLPSPARVEGFSDALEDALLLLELHARNLLRHVAHDLGVSYAWVEGLLDPDLEGRPLGRKQRVGEAPSDALAGDDSAQSGGEPSLRHSLLRACRYEAGMRGVGGSSVLCDEHTDVGFITLDAHACRPGLALRRRADRQWLDVESEDAPSCETIAVMVGDTLERASAGYYEASPHRVHAPTEGERIGLPFLLRGRSDAVIDTRKPHEEGLAAGRVVHLARMESSRIKELPALDAAQSILHGWFRSSKAPTMPST